jgi:hypothetical protein
MSSRKQKLFRAGKEVERPGAAKDRISSGDPKFLELAAKVARRVKPFENVTFAWVVEPSGMLPGADTFFVSFSGYGESGAGWEARPEMDSGSGAPARKWLPVSPRCADSPQHE